MNNPKGIIVIIVILLAVVIPAGASHVDMRVARLLSGEILQQAEKESHGRACNSNSYKSHPKCRRYP